MERERADQDAKRYRWLRACGDEWDNVPVFDSRGRLTAESLDSAIDAAIRKEPE